MLNYIQTVGVQVSDQNKALDFYVNTLGLEKTSDQPMDEKSRWIVVTPSGARTGIVLSSGFGPGQMGVFTGFIFHTDNIEATYATLAGRGVHFTVPPKMEPWGRWAQFADPDGNEFGLWASPAG
jgi:predicted enzyme related to lactoylglutathione lyase